MCVSCSGCSPARNGDVKRAAGKCHDATYNFDTTPITTPWEGPMTTPWEGTPCHSARCQSAACNQCHLRHLNCMANYHSTRCLGVACSSSWETKLRASSSKPHKRFGFQRLLVALLWVCLCSVLLGCSQNKNARSTVSSSQGDLPSSPTQLSERGLAVKVVSVIDGDTVVIEIQEQSAKALNHTPNSNPITRVQGGTETVRILGIDTPEKTGGPRAAECFGDQAKQYANKLMPKGSTIWLKRDVETRDRYGRLLGFIWLEDGTFYNLHMLEKGYATPLFIGLNQRYQQDFESAADAARKSWVGFWQHCGGPDVLLQSDHHHSAPSAAASE